MYQETIVNSRPDRELRKKIITPGDYNLVPFEDSRCKITLTDISCTNTAGNCLIEPESRIFSSSFDGNVLIGDTDSFIDKDFELILQQMCCGETSDATMVYRDGSGALVKEIKCRIELREVTEEQLISEWGWMRLYEAATHHKERGVELVKEKRIADAFRRFSKALKMLIAIEPIDPEVIDEERVQEMIDFKTTVRRWVRNHRLHHKCSDTPADPHDANRGFFFSHIGWLMMKKNEDVLRMGKTIDMSDIENDTLLMWHERHVAIVNLLCCYVVPSLAGVYLCGEGWQCFIRNLTVLHVEMTVNSLAHMYGYKPYNKTIKPGENWLVNLLTFGEGSHNYHHAFPYDYKTRDWFSAITLTTATIRASKKLGFIYDLRDATPHVVNSMAERLGDRKT